MDEHCNVEYSLDGAYGVVYRAMDRVNNEKVALKRIKLENEEGTENLVFLLFFLL